MSDTIQDLLALAEDDPAEFNRRCVWAMGWVVRGHDPTQYPDHLIIVAKPARLQELHWGPTHDHNHAAELVAKAVERDERAFACHLARVLSCRANYRDNWPVDAYGDGLLDGATATATELSVAALATLEC